jgi:hypothetical protein
MEEETVIGLRVPRLVEPEDLMKDTTRVVEREFSAYPHVNPL